MVEEERSEGGGGGRKLGRRIGGREGEGSVGEERVGE